MKRTSMTGCIAGIRVGAAALMLWGAASGSANAYERYNDGCVNCHGAFTDGTSPQGTVFPNNDKHRMHRNSANMGTACVLCHRSDDNSNPFIGSSDGNTNAVPPVPQLGCTGCHNAAGLRRHHVANGGTCNSVCHTPQTPPAENVKPPYYGLTGYTKADNPCNTVAVANTNENWSIGDFIGLDNDGNNLYDLADFACGGAYLITGITREGDNVRVTWQTAGGRKEVVQAGGLVTGAFTNISAVISNAGVGIKTTNFVEIGGGTNNPARFYRVRNSP